MLGSVLLLASACSGSFLGNAMSYQNHQAQDEFGGYSYTHSHPSWDKLDAKEEDVMTHRTYPEGQGYEASHADRYTKLRRHAPAHANRRIFSDGAWHGHERTAVIRNRARVGAPITRRTSRTPGPSSYDVWYGSQHVPAIANGVPEETPEVRHAKAAHAAAHARIRKQGRAQIQTTPSYDDWRGFEEDHVLNQDDSRLEYADELQGAWRGPQHVPVIENGVPLETPEVQEARAAHEAAHAAAHALLERYAAARGQQEQNDAVIDVPETRNSVWQEPRAAPVRLGIPLETPEVRQAKAAHLAAHVGLNKGNPPARVTRNSSTPSSNSGWRGAQHVPVIKDGVPLDTPEVQLAKAAHLNALASAGGITEALRSGEKKKP